MRKTPIAALVSAEIVSILGSRMTYLALPWFVLVTTGSAAKMTYVLAAEILPMALLGIPCGHGGRAARRPADDARLRRRALPAARLAPPAALGRPAHLPAAARARLPARLLHGAVLRGAAGHPARARGRGRAHDRPGEQPDRGRHGGRSSRRARARRPADPVHERAERALRRRGHICRLVPPSGRLRPEDKEARRRRCERRRPRWDHVLRPRPAAGAARRNGDRAQLRRLGVSVRRFRSTRSTSSRAPASRASSTPPAAPGRSSAASPRCSR